VAGRRGSEIDIDERLIVRLLEEQAPHLAGLPAMKVRDGWDNAVWRIGDVLAIRITRRAVAVDLHRHEQSWLPVLAPGLPLPVPAPLIVGVPSAQFPWPWSVVPWFEGDIAALAPRSPEKCGRLAAFWRPCTCRHPKTLRRIPPVVVPLRCVRTLWRCGLSRR